MSVRRVLVVGATGRLGGLVVRELRARGAAVRAGIRNVESPGAAALRELGAEIVELDPTKASPEAIARALEGVHVVVSTMQGGPDVIVDAQLRLLDAAEKAGVSRFFPSDYSFDFFRLPQGINVNSDWRRTFAERAEARGGRVEIVHLMQGIFADAFVTGFVGLYDRERNVVGYWGDGTVPIDWTTWEDTARYLAAAVLDARPVPSKLYVAGDRASALDLVVHLASVRARPSVVRHGSLDELRTRIAERLASAPGDMYGWLPLMYALGMFSGEAQLGALANDRYPDIRPETLRDAIGRGAL